MLMRATTTFWHGKDLYQTGEIYDAAHPAVVRFAKMFEPIESDEVAAVAPVESATSAPGEKRATVASNRRTKAQADD